MLTISEMFQQALLAEASYVLLDKIDYSDPIQVESALKDPLNKGKFSQAQAAEFVNTWEVIHHQPDTTSGFSATLFRNKTTGEYSYAVRGTAGATDIAADIGNIVLDGLAMDQIVDMYNHWKMLATPQNQSYQQAELVTLAEGTLGVRSCLANFN